MITEVKSNEYGFMYSGFFKENIVTYNMMLELMKNKHRAFADTDMRLIAVWGVKKTLWVCVEKNVTTAERNQLLGELVESVRDLQIEAFASDTQTAVILKKLFKPYKFFLQEKLTAYSCKAPKPLDVIRGRMRKATARDTATVNKLANLFFTEYYGVKSAGVKLDEPIELMKTSDIYLWEDKGKVAAMAAVTCKSQGKARINYVCVEEKFRNMGYGKMLTASLCRLLINEGFEPVLYSKQSDKTANGMYAGAGFEKGGSVDVYSY